ncbi:MAG: pilus assembly protein PilM [Pseudomonas sp.]|uniref:type IV pilus biogenesis protein PilM n=1 Tax=Pseudomonas sp. TaxID=306 RepID=UPI001D753876|nr:pilus assembly protein PilM [Pseudomonas sp.]MPS97094.1 pilus assembly protein PilM [Pseudomonas sp.]
MFGRFGKDAGSLLGVEITSDSVRMLQLQRRRGRCQVLGWAVEPIDLPSVGEQLADSERIVSALRRAHRRTGIRQRQVAMALPANQVICKVCQLPAGQSETELEAQLLLDADQLFPFPLEDLALDFQILGASPVQPGTLDVMVVACRQSALDPFEALFLDAGLALEVVEVDSLALQRMLPKPGADDLALVRIERGSATLHYWPQGALPQRREVQLAPPATREQVRCAVQQLLDEHVSVSDILVASHAPPEPGLFPEWRTQRVAPCQRLPPRPGLGNCSETLVLAYALALGGMGQCRA